MIRQLGLPGAKNWVACPEADLGKIELQLLRFSLSSSASYFLTILFRNAGVNSQNGRLILNFVNTVVSACGALMGTALTDKGGAKGMAMYALAVACASFVNTYAGPIALQNIGWKFSVEAYGQCRLGVYVAWGLFECVVIYLFVVETRGRTLEELNEIFEDPNPVRASIRKRKVALAGDKVIPVNEPGHSV
ncbi:hypothetical protein C8J57DRAFT_1569367 [Mycena rebaudengoi]|nr:hypothetical protein C8J57DRAFT_1569367 [Mycena rebaudengoi]